MRAYQNHLGLSAIRSKCILIADGPSKEIILSDPTTVTEEYSVAVVNQAGHQWSGRKDYWFSLHPGLLPEWKKNAENLLGCVFVGFKSPHLDLSPDIYRNTNYRIFT